MTDEQFAKRLDALASELGGMRQELHLTNESIVNLTAMQSRIYEEITKEIPPSSLAEPMQQLAAAVSDQTLAIRDLSDSIATQPEAFRQAVRDELDAREGKGS